MKKILLLLVLSSFFACSSSAVYRTARIIKPNTGDFSLTFNTTHFVDKGGKSITLPNILPDFSYHYAFTKDIEGGFRVSLLSGLVEADAKYRFFNSDGWHVALDPALGYVAWGIISQAQFSLPLIFTYDISINY